MRMQRLSNIAQKRRPDSMLSPAISNFIVKEIIKERELKKSNQMVDEETVGRAR